MCKKIIAWISVFAIAFSCVAPVFASSTSGEYKSRSTFYSWLAEKGGVLQDFAGFLSGNQTCPNSSDGYHHASSFQKSAGGTTGLYDCICRDCGHYFTAYETDLQAAYSSYVSDLPATGINSAGQLVWSPAFRIFNIDYTSYVGDLSGTDYAPSSSVLCSYSCSDGVSYFSLAPSSGNSFSCYPEVLIYDRFPVSGVYSFPSGARSLSLSYALTYFVSSGSNLWDGSFNFTNGLGFHSAGDVLSASKAILNSSWTFYSATLQVQNPVFYITPADSLGDIYNTDSRTGSIIGNLGIFNIDGDLEFSFNGSLFDELGSLYYNPTTNEYHTVNNWTYDYSDRSYNLTLESGDTVNITYGDEYITVRQGDTVYNVYYIINGEGSGELHRHSYVPTVKHDPTCTSPGSITYVCSECNDTYSEVLPAAGHDWQLVERVEPEYDDEGNVTVEGYALYRCSVCQEEYKDLTGAGPPSADDLASSGIIVGWLKAIYDKLCEILKAITGHVGDSDEENDALQVDWFNSFVSKFAFLSDVSSIYKQLVADITNDAQTASLLADGTITIDMVTTDHAVPLVNDAPSPGGGGVGGSYTAPELAISLGSSDKYGVDWASIKPMDLSWYAPYKETVDGIVSGFLWLGYIFLLIKRLPDLVRGAGMVTEDGIRVDMWNSHKK